MSQNINRHCLDVFMKHFGTNVPEVFEILGLVLKTRAKLRIVDKSMLLYNEHGAFISKNKTRPLVPEHTALVRPNSKAAVVSHYTWHSLKPAQIPNGLVHCEGEYCLVVCDYGNVPTGTYKVLEQKLAETSLK